MHLTFLTGDRKSVENLSHRQIIHHISSIYFLCEWIDVPVSWNVIFNMVIASQETFDISTVKGEVSWPKYSE